MRTAQRSTSSSRTDLGPGAEVAPEPWKMETQCSQSRTSHDDGEEVSRGCCTVGGQFPQQESWAHLVSSLKHFKTTILIRSTCSCTKSLSAISFHSTAERWTGTISLLAQGTWASRTQPVELLDDVLSQDSRRNDWPQEATRVVPEQGGTTKVSKVLLRLRWTGKTLASRNGWLLNSPV